jgi:hypothetical protein
LAALPIGAGPARRWSGRRRLRSQVAIDGSGRLADGGMVRGRRLRRGFGVLLASDRRRLLGGPLRRLRITLDRLLLTPDQLRPAPGRLPLAPGGPRLVPGRRRHPPARLRFPRRGGRRLGSGSRWVGTASGPTGVAIWPGRRGRWRLPASRTRRAGVLLGRGRGRLADGLLPARSGRTGPGVGVGVAGRRSRRLRSTLAGTRRRSGLAWALGREPPGQRRGRAGLLRTEVRRRVRPGRFGRFRRVWWEGP